MAINWEKILVFLISTIVITILVHETIYSMHKTKNKYFNINSPLNRFTGFIILGIAIVISVLLIHYFFHKLSTYIYITFRSEFFQI